MSPETSFIDQILATSVLEWLAVLSGVIYVILVSLRSIYCWLFALISSAIYIYICIIYNLYIESGLQAFYAFMAIYGWYVWSAENRMKTFDVLDEKNDEVGPTIIRWTFNEHVMNIVISGVVAYGLGFIFQNYTDQANPYMDAFTTVYSLAATYMVTQKALGNWVYWIVIDLVSIYLYSSRGLQLSAVLYGLFTILAVIGFITWRKQFKRSLG